MASLLNFASKCSWMACGLCAVLAILSVPQSARADDLDDCYLGCAGKDIMSGDWQACIDDCIATQCKNKVDEKGKFLGCNDPGGKCKLPLKMSLCGLSVAQTNCTCTP